jgi:hypothetical protein
MKGITTCHTDMEKLFRDLYKTLQGEVPVLQEVPQELAVATILVIAMLVMTIASFLQPDVSKTAQKVRIRTEWAYDIIHINTRTDMILLYIISRPPIPPPSNLSPTQRRVRGRITQSQ